MINGKFQFNWIITVLEKDEQGLVIEMADLGNDKYMIVATDTAHPILDKVSYRQAGFGPFFLQKDADFSEQIQVLKKHLIENRPLVK